MDLPQLVRFLNGVRYDRLAGIWWLIALRGLRRGDGEVQAAEDAIGQRVGTVADAFFRALSAPKMPGAFG